MFMYMVDCLYLFIYFLFIFFFLHFPWLLIERIEGIFFKKTFKLAKHDVLYCASRAPISTIIKIMSFVWVPPSEIQQKYLRF